MVLFKSKFCSDKEKNMEVVAERDKVHYLEMYAFLLTS